MNGLVDLIVVGSGPSGAQAAKAAIDRGLTVVVVDVGIDDESFASIIPNRAFHELHASDPEQHRYFLGEMFKGVSKARSKVVAQLTAPRQFITRGFEKYLPFESPNFFPVQSLALGGLGAGWGAGTHTYEDFELREAGLSVEAMRAFYQETSDDIGISGGAHDDTARMVLDISRVQKPLDIDSNARSIFRSYARRRMQFQKKGFFLGRSPAAILTEKTENWKDFRGPNPYHDMDFYSDHGRSVYRPKYTIEALSRHPKFRYLGESLVERFEEDPDGSVQVFCKNTSNGARFSVKGRRLALAAGALNSARIVLSSLKRYEVKIPVLCNPYHYIPCMNLRMLGRPADDRRHSLAQLTGLFTSRGRYPDRVIGAFYSYRSLLLFRLVKDMPLPPVLGVQVARLLQTSLTIIGMHHADRFSKKKWLELRKGSDGREVLGASFELTAEEQSDVKGNLRSIIGYLLGLNCVPLGVTTTGFGTSIHYAGTLPSSDDPNIPLATSSTGRLHGTRGVYLADSSSWKFLPAKGLTFTLMANARRVVHEISRELCSR